MVAVAYLRKSRVTSERGVSWDVQEAAVRELDHESSVVALALGAERAPYDQVTSDVIADDLDRLDSCRDDVN